MTEDPDKDLEPWLIPEQEWVLFVVGTDAGREVSPSRKLEDGVD